MVPDACHTLGIVPPCVLARPTNSPARPQPSLSREQAAWASDGGMLTLTSDNEHALLEHALLAAEGQAWIIVSVATR